MTPGLLMAAAFAVEVGGWAAAQVSLQRSADVSAMAGAIYYLGDNNGQKAATFAARMAQLNGGNGTGSPSWNSGTNTLTDNQITAQVVTGYMNANDTALMVTIQKTIPAGISSVFNQTATNTVTATRVAELVYVNDRSERCRCRSALPVGAVHFRHDHRWNRELDRHAELTMRSNGTISFTGGGTIDARATSPRARSASNRVSPSPALPINPTAPFRIRTLNNTPLQSAITTAAGLTGETSLKCYSGSPPCTGLAHGSTCSGTYGAVTCTLYPGIMAAGPPRAAGRSRSISAGAVFVQRRDLVFANDDGHRIGGDNHLDGRHRGRGTVTFTASAPTASEAAAASPQSIAGVVLASTSSTGTNFSGATTFNPSGVVYLPNSAVYFSGSSSSVSSPATGNSSTPYCLEIIASSITIVGYFRFRQRFL